MRKILLTILICLWAGSAWGATYNGVTYTEVFYVRADGQNASDPETYPPTQASCWDRGDVNNAGNWDSGVDADDGKIGANDCVVFMGTGGDFSDAIAFLGSGSLGKQITLYGDTTIDSSNPVVFEGSDALNNALNTNSKHYVSILGKFTLQNYVQNVIQITTGGLGVVIDGLVPGGITIDCRDMENSRSGIYILTATAPVLRNITIAYATNSGGLVNRGIYVRGTDNGTFSDLSVSECERCCIEFSGDGANESDGNTVSDSVFDGGDSDVGCVVLAGASATNIIEDCETKNGETANASGIVFLGTASNNVIQRCNIHDNIHDGVSVHDGQIGNTIKFCSIWNNADGGISYGGGANGADIYNNVIAFNGDGGGGRAGLYLDGATSETSNIKNNICYKNYPREVECDVAGGSTQNWDYNIYYHPSGAGGKDSGQTIVEATFGEIDGAAKTYTQWFTDLRAGDESHSDYADPLFISATDFKLTRTSPCINAGTNWPSGLGEDVYDLANEQIWDGAGNVALGAWLNGAEIGTYGYFQSGVAGWGSTPWSQKRWGTTPWGVSSRAK